jgi:acetylornithine/succinyldiaminopimelate/putrescine aminotransferase
MYWITVEAIYMFCFDNTQVIEEEKIQENAAKTGTYFILELRKLMDEFEMIGDVRGKGLMIGVELVQERVRAVDTSVSGWEGYIILGVDLRGVKSKLTTTWAKCFAKLLLIMVEMIYLKNVSTSKVIGKSNIHILMLSGNPQ